jgi:ATP-binding protein involved in chromosome partitioning
MIDLDAARAALGAVMLPDGTPLSASPRLSLAAGAGRVTATITIENNEADGFAAIRTAAEKALRAQPGAEQAVVVLTAERAAEPAAPKLKATVGRKPEVLAGVTSVIAVASGKGGVGKSTTTVNLALALQAEGLRVGILDADIYGPSLPTLLGLHGQPRVGTDRKLIPMQAYGLAAMSIGLLVEDETAMIWRGPMVMSAITQLLTEVDWGRLDMLLVDMPPGTGDAQLAIAQGTRLAGAVIVSTPQDLALIDARRGVSMFRKVEVPILGLVENMAHFICPDCGGRHAIFGEGGARVEARRLGVPYLGAIPLTMDLREASDAGRPPVARDPEGTLGQAYRVIARAVLKSLK